MVQQFGAWRVATLWAATGAMALALGGPPALAADPTYDFNLPSGALGDTLLAVAAKGHQQLFYQAGLVSGRRAPPLMGRFTMDAALARILAGTGLQTQRAAPGVLVLRAQRPLTPAAAVSDASDPPAAGAGAAPGAQDGSGAGPSETVTEVVVTGTHLRGAGVSASPITTLDRLDLDRQGRATVAEALEALPQAFGGTATDETGYAGADQAGTNTSFANSVNLRGLGADATLVLINGRRLAGSGSKGDFTDLSSIPLAAIDHIDVLLDGASAIYGSDAVGGVVNVIMRNDYEGAETSSRLGSVTDGPTEEAEFAQTFGHHWSLGALGDGSALISVENYRRTALPAADRPYAANADLVPFGGTDHRTYYSNPGNIIGYDPATGSFGPTYAIPAGQNGVGLQPGDFLPGQENLENIREGMDILPLQDRTSIYGAVTQDLGSKTKLSLDVHLSARDYRLYGPGQASILTVTPADPYYVSPNGAPYEYVGYSFYDEIGSPVISGHENSYGVTLGGSIDLPDDWQARAYGAIAQDQSFDGGSHEINTALLNEALGNAPPDPSSGYSAARYGSFNPFGAGDVNSRALLDFLSQGYSNTRNLSRVSSVDLDADGTLANLPGGPMKLAVGAQGRWEYFGYGGTDFLDYAAPTPTGDVEASRSVGAAFAELRVPLFGPSNARFGFERLDLSIAGRVETYSDVGTTFNPKFGLVWVPEQSLTIRATYGTSFRAPALREVHDPLVVDPVTLPEGANQILSLILYGGNPKLRPQTAVSTTAGIDFVPKAVPGLRLSSTFFDTNFDNRIGTPVLDNPYTALTDPTVASFVTRVDPQTNPADLARLTALINSPGSLAAGLYPAQAYGAIVDARYVNTAHLHVQGVDLSAAYAFAVPLGRLNLDADVSYLATYSVQATPTSPAINDVDVVGYPTAWRGRLAATWTWDPWGATAALNYVGAHHDAGDVQVGSWSTVDLQLRWKAPAQTGLAHGLTLSVNVQNLFDQDPPFYNSPAGVGYDASTATALGRFVSMQLVKAW